MYYLLGWVASSIDGIHQILFLHFHSQEGLHDDWETEENRIQIWPFLDILYRNLHHQGELARSKCHKRVCTFYNGTSGDITLAIFRAILQISPKSDVLFPLSLVSFSFVEGLKDETSHQRYWSSFYRLSLSLRLHHCLYPRSLYRIPSFFEATIRPSLQPWFDPSL